MFIILGRASLLIDQKGFTIDPESLKSIFLALQA